MKGGNRKNITKQENEKRRKKERKRRKKDREKGRYIKQLTKRKENGRWGLNKNFQGGH